MEKNAMMIIGLGDLGGYVLEFLARTPNIRKIVTADMTEDWGTRKTNSAPFDSPCQKAWKYPGPSCGCFIGGDGVEVFSKNQIRIGKEVKP